MRVRCSSEGDEHLIMRTKKLANELHSTNRTESHSTYMSHICFKSSKSAGSGAWSELIGLDPVSKGGTDAAAAIGPPFVFCTLRFDSGLLVSNKILFLAVVALHWAGSASHFSWVGEYGRFGRLARF
jgi:hypothetical protein